MTSGPSPKLCFPTCKFIFLSSRIDASLVAISHFFQIKLTYPLSFLTFIIKYARIRNNIWCWLLLHFVSGWSYFLGGAGSPLSDTLILYAVNFLYQLLWYGLCLSKTDGSESSTLMPFGLLFRSVNLCGEMSWTLSQLGILSIDSFLLQTSFSII